MTECTSGPAKWESWAVTRMRGRARARILEILKDPALTVANLEFLLLGAKDGQIESVSLGEEKPQCSDHGESCWAKNRRDDMLYGGEY